MNATMEPKRRVRKRWLWASLNVAGMLLFLKVGSALWVVPGEEGMPGGPGDAFYFSFAVVPILVAFLLLDLAALGWIFLKTPRPNRLTALAVWFAIVALWCGAVMFDDHKSFRKIEARYSNVMNLVDARGRSDSKRSHDRPAARQSGLGLLLSPYIRVAAGDQADGSRCCGLQLCGSNSSIREAACVCTRMSTSAR
jgi:hypothetical protein